MRFKTLSEAGCETVEDVLRTGSGALAGIHGVSETTARQLVAAAQQLRQAVRDDLRFRIALDRSDQIITRLLAELYLLRRYDRVLEGRGQEIQDTLNLLAPLAAVPPDVTRLTLLGRTDPANILTDVRAEASLLVEGGLLELVSQISPRSGEPPKAPQVWDDFESDSAGYYTTLSQVVDLNPDPPLILGVEV